MYVWLLCVIEIRVTKIYFPTLDYFFSFSCSSSKRYQVSCAKNSKERLRKAPRKKNIKNNFLNNGKVNQFNPFVHVSLTKLFLIDKRLMKE